MDQRLATLGAENIGFLFCIHSVDLTTLRYAKECKWDASSNYLYKYASYINTYISFFLHPDVLKGEAPKLLTKLNLPARLTA